MYNYSVVEKLIPNTISDITHHHYNLLKNPNKCIFIRVFAL